MLETAYFPLFVNSPSKHRSAVALFPFRICHGETKKKATENENDDFINI
jgi:hypothetical protein